MKEEYEGFDIGVGEGIGCEEIGTGAGIRSDERPDIITNEEEWV